MLDEAGYSGLVKTRQNETYAAYLIWFRGRRWPELRRPGGNNLHTIQSAIPDPGLRQFVRCFAQREMSVQTSWLVQTSLASLEHTLAFYVGDQPVMEYVSGKRAFIPRIHLVGT